MDPKLNRRQFIVGVSAFSVLSLFYFFKHQKQVLMAPNPTLVGEIPLEHWSPIRAMAPVVLAGVYRGDQDWEDFFSSLQLTLFKLEPATQQEFHQLLDYLSFPLVRRGFFELSDDWHAAKPEAIETMLKNWRESRWLKKRAAYQASLALIYSAWYAQAKNWVEIGYDGPPAWNS